MSVPSTQVASDSSVKLIDSPIPEEQILEGEPKARMWISAQSPDLKVTQGVWDCTAGKFTWNYTWDEFVFILEGEATVIEQGGESKTFKAGDHVNFPAGLSATWHIPEYIKEDVCPSDTGTAGTLCLTQLEPEWLGPVSLP